MNTPVLSKLQKKLSLSGKKAKKEIIKNVVVDPHKSYWPLVDSELESLTNVLKENLPRVRYAKVNVPWRLLKNIPKDERKKIRDSYIKKHCPPGNLIKETNLILGVNEVAKVLESDSCSVVLVENMNPRIVVKHIIEIAVLKDVPVLVIPNLKQILKDVCGLESMALAIKKPPLISSNLECIVTAVVETHKEYPTHVNHINSARCTIFPQLNNIEKSDEPVNSVQYNQKDETINYHLVKKSTNERAFVPEWNTNELPSIMETEMNSIIEFKKPLNKKLLEASREIKNKKKNKKLYKALIVKRLKGNKNREKDKNTISKVKK